MRKKYIFYTILCIVCFILGLVISKSSKLAITDDTLYINNVRIIVEDNVNESIANQYIKDIEAMPEFLLENCNAIVITSEDLNEKFNFNFSNVVRAVTVDDIIYINDSKFKSDVVIHELFHVYDYKNNWISIENKDFLNVYENECDIVKVSPGNNENAQEFFATIGAEYITNSEDLKEYAPLSFEFMSNLLATSH